MLNQLVVAGVASVYKFIAKIKEFSLLYNDYFGMYQITSKDKILAHPTTEEDAWKRISILAGTRHNQPQCWDSCKLHNCSDCERYY